MSAFWRLRLLRIRKSGIWSSMKLGMLLVYIAIMAIIVVTLVKKTSNIFGSSESSEALVDDRGMLKVPDEVLQFEAQAKPGLGAHGQAVRLTDQSEKDIEDQLKVIKIHNSIKGITVSFQSEGLSFESRPGSKQSMPKT